MALRCTSYPCRPVLCGEHKVLDVGCGSSTANVQEFWNFCMAVGLSDFLFFHRDQAKLGKVYVTC